MTIDEKIEQNIALQSKKFYPVGIGENFHDKNLWPRIYLKLELFKASKFVKSEMLADMQPLLMVISKSRDDFWFMQTLLERTTDDKYLRDAVNDCIERMKFRKPMFEKALAEFNAKYKEQK